ncbi:YcfL protein [Vibrio ponticus]|uniref:YcfL family protein n=1 Tax=Vibrio rhodolitus TaxID=2231649 RepID=UPI0005056880|nr:YcfL family protein [Vibrio rhodolitus]GAK87834.1 YcfL protein [Vibrio ponticus]
MKKFVLVMLSMFAIAGCATNTSGLRIDGSTQKVLFANDSMSRSLEVNDITTTVVDGHVQGIVSLTSNISSDHDLLYRFYWYDGQGLEVSKPANWRRLIIRGEETVSISEVAVNPSATEFRVQIRKNND